MEKMKWWDKLLIALILIVFSPLIILFLLIGFIIAVLEYPKNKKAYLDSQYYKDLGLPFKTDRFYSPRYKFYNSAKSRSLPMEYVRQESNGFEYFVFNDVLFLFPDFTQIHYDEEKSEWQVYYDGGWENFEESYRNIASRLDENAPSLPVHILIEREMFPEPNLNEVELPDCVFPTCNYENAFGNDDEPLKIIIPQTTRELYEMMLATPELCGSFEMPSEEGNIIWKLCDGIQIELGVDPHDCYFGVSKNVCGKLTIEITHWHPTASEIYGEVCEIGKRGNVLVIGSSLGSSSVLYSGEKGKCPYTPDSRWCGKKVHYFEAN